MGLIVKPAAFTASTLTPSQMNILMDTIYDEFGTTTNGQGNIGDINLSNTAGLNKTKIGDTALVAGNVFAPGLQIVTRPTMFKGTLVLDKGTFPTHGAGSFTEAVGGHGLWYTGPDTGAVSITDFTGHTSGQTFIVLKASIAFSTTLVHAGGVMELRNNANAVLNNFKQTITLWDDAGVWVELDRNF
jgi:hypothetical protein